MLFVANSGGRGVEEKKKSVMEVVDCKLKSNAITGVEMGATKGMSAKQKVVTRASR